MANPSVSPNALRTVEVAAVPMRRAAEHPSGSDTEHVLAGFLRSFQVLLHSARLYQKNHPRILESLEAVERDLRAALATTTPLTIGVERDRLVTSHRGGPHGQTLADPRGELSALAGELTRCGITSLHFLPQTNLGEFAQFAELLNARGAGVPSARASESHGRDVRRDWAELLAERRISGIRVNRPIERKDESVLAGLVAAVLAYDDAPHSPAFAVRVPTITLEQLSKALRLLTRMIPDLEEAQQAPPQEAARTVHAALAEANRHSVNLLVSAVSRETPRDGEPPEPYLNRLADLLVLEFARQELRAGRVTPVDLRSLVAHLEGERAQQPGRSVPDESRVELLYERLWRELPTREKSEVLHSPNAWCIPAGVLRHYLEPLAAATRRGHSDVSAREARSVLLHYVKCLESEESHARRAVASGLIELQPLLERLWAPPLSGELNRVVVRALEREASPSIAGLLSAVTENLARLALGRSEYADFEHILTTIEQAPRDAEHAHMVTLTARLIAQDRWLLLVDAALANRPLDPALPRLLRRDPERLLDRLGLLLTSTDGLTMMPAMVRLLRGVGEPAYGVLETRLFEARRQRAATAVKLLTATQPQRLVKALPRALPNWDWGLQDLAVTELARHPDKTLMSETAGAFLASVEEAHPLVVPLMLDHIGMAQETSALPLLLEIAAGENERLRDVFIRIKALEALGRMRAAEAIDLLRQILRQRNGLTHAEPAGLRAAAEEALALIENRPSSARVRATQEALEKASVSFARARRYLRVPLPVPFRAQIDGPQPVAARVRTISLGGAFLESSRRFNVGDSIRLEIRAGLRRIHSTAVVRNISTTGGGIEFVHMKPEDREKLRRLLRRLLR